MPINLSIKADKNACEINLGFPYHGQQSNAQVLGLIQQYLHDEKIEILAISTVDAARILEDKIAQLFGAESAAWFPTGTLAQGIAVKIHTQVKGHNGLFLHPTSHLLLHEEQGYDVAYGLSAQVVGSWRSPLTAEDLIGDTKCAIIELPQRHSGGKLPSWEALNQLKQHCSKNDIALHMDGARLWSCLPFYTKRSYADIVDGFDSVYVSLYKDIGAIGGAVLLGGKEFINHAKQWRTRLGGLSVGSWPMIVDSLRLLDLRLSRIDRYVEKAQSMAAAISDLSNIEVDPFPPHSNLFHVHLPVPVKSAEQARDKLATEKSIWLSDRFWGYESDQHCAMEVVVGEKTLDVSNQVFRESITELISNLALG